jgi:murein DD-endopeptidase MepM/ murein hydrolase activator NlpD
MLRLVAVVVLVALAALAALWQFGVLANPFDRAPRLPPVPPLLTALEQDDLDGIRSALAAGADPSQVDANGRTALMVAAQHASPAALEALLAHGAEVDWRAADGTSALMLALRHARTSEVPLLLLNAGADPQALDAAGNGVLHYADQNSAVRNSGLYPRLRELTQIPVRPGWPSAYVVPVPGATLSSRAAHWPNAPRYYRNGVHEGFDFFDGAVSGSSITYGTAIVAMASGTVIRADHDYVEMTREEYDEVIRASRSSMITSDDLLDRLRGMQVWLEHPGGFLTRYAHLSGVAPEVVVGARVEQGQVIAFTGNSGTIEAAEGTKDDPHPHVEVWRDDRYLGQGMEPAEIFDMARQLFGSAGLPPRWVP